MTAKRYEDPEYGTLIKIDEVARLTGISKASIRNWRKPDWEHLAKFNEYEIPGSVALWYRLDDVELWMKENGRDPNGVRATAIPRVKPNAVDAPRKAPMDPRKHELLLRLQKITTENAFTMFRHLDPVDPHSRKCYNLSMEGFRKANEQWVASNPGDPETFKTVHLADMPYSKNMFPMRKHFDANPESVSELARWFYVLVNSQRIRIADLTPGILSAKEICEIPIGNVPPLNESFK